MILVFLVLSPLFSAQKKPKTMTVHEKALALGLVGAPPRIEQRHVEITENSPTINPTGDTPVHIMFRVNKNSSWVFRGTGTVMGKTPNFILTAYHVLEGDAGEYGWRKICPDEFVGKERIYPLTDYVRSGYSDDAILCSTDTNRMNFPRINLPVSTSIFRDWGTEDYTATAWPVKVHLSTYPEKTIQNLFHIQVKPNVFHYIMDHEMMPGESGTMAFIEGEKTNACLVMIRGQAIPKMMIDQLTPVQKQGIHWNENKLYAVGVLVGIH